MLTIDGSMLEGGGQLTRLTLSLAAITGQPVRIHSIRAGRSARGKKPVSGSHRGSGRDRDRDRGRGGRGKTRGNQSRTDNNNNTTTATAVAAAGLKDSHLAALEFLAEHCGAKVVGAQVNSTEVVFRPSTAGLPPLQIGPDGRDFLIDLQKSGSVWLIFQAVFPFLVFGSRWTGNTTSTSTSGTTARAEEGTTQEDKAVSGGGGGGGGDNDTGVITLTITGGTNVPKAMSTEYMTQVFLPTMSRVFGVGTVEIETIKRGWAGNAPAVGEVRIKIHRPPPVLLGSHSPSPTNHNQHEHEQNHDTFTLPAFSLHDRGPITQIDISVIADPAPTRSTILTTLTTLLSATFPSVPVTTVLDEPSDDDRRQYILLVAHTGNGSRLGRDFLGGGGRAKTVTEGRKKIDEACLTVVKGLEREVGRGGCVDKHMQDQVVCFQALAEGRSRVSGGLGVGGEGEREGVDEDEDEDGNEVGGEKVERVGDESGTLHTRTVRWVCNMMLKEYGVRFERGGICHGIGWNGVGCKKTVLDELGMENLQIQSEDEEESK